MKTQEQHDYLIALIKELEKAGNETNLNNFIIVLEDTLKVKYRLRNYFDYPISAADYEELITYAENLLGVNRMGSKDDPHYEHLDGIKYEDTKIGAYSCFCINGIQVANYHFNEYDEQYEFYNTNNQLIATITASKVDDKDEWNKLASLFGDAECCVMSSTSGRTTPTSGGPGASNDVDSFNTMSDIEVEALVDQALVNMELVDHIIKNYTPDQLTIDIVKQAAAGHMVDGVKVNVIDGMKVNRQTADFIEMKIKQIQKNYDAWIPNAETIAAIKEAETADPKDLHSWEDVKKEFFGDKNEANYQKYWTKGRDAHFFYGDDYLDAWKSADLWHRDIYYWPYNEQIIVGQVNPVEWYKTKGDEVQWGPIFGPFNSPEEFDNWYVGFWNWWHALSDDNKVIYHNIPTMDNQWPLWNTDYIEMFRKYAAIKSEYDYNKIAADAQNDKYSKMTEEDYMKLYYNAPPKAFTKEWNERVAAFIGDIKEIESNLEERDNEFDGEIIQDLERKLLDFLKKTL